jgi:hypothetical protein
MSWRSASSQDFIDPDGFRVHALIRAQPVKKGRHKGLHHKETVVDEMVGDVPEAAHLAFLGQQVE